MNYIAEERPTIACLCGSTRFRETFGRLAKKLTLERGYIVLSCCVWGHSGDTITDEQKTALDVLHRRKMDLADEIWVVSEGGYIGDSTRTEIAYAEEHGKQVFRYDVSARDKPTSATELIGLKRLPLKRLETECPIDSLKSTLAFAVDDWSRTRAMAWVWGIVHGWEGESLEECKAEFRWTDEACARLGRLHDAFEALEASRTPPVPPK